MNKTVNVYKMELDALRHPILVKENEFDFHNKITSPDDVKNFCNNVFNLSRLAEENVVLIALNTKGEILGMFKVSQGTGNTAFCSPREVYMRAMCVGAINIILVHNHPSGDTTPSKEDRIICKKMKEAGEILNINLLDFFIVGDDYYSFADKGEFCLIGSKA